MEYHRNPKMCDNTLQPTVSTRALSVWTCILGVWICIWVSGFVVGCVDLFVGAGMCIWVSGLVFGCLGLAWVIGFVF